MTNKTSAMPSVNNNNNDPSAVTPPHHSNSSLPEASHEEQLNWPPQPLAELANEHTFIDPSLGTLETTLPVGTFVAPPHIPWDARYNNFDPQQDYAPTAPAGTEAPSNNATPWTTSGYVPSTSTAAAPFSSNTLGPYLSPITTLATVPTQTIGFVQRNIGSNGYYLMCSRPECNEKTFRRWAELNRHEQAFHGERDDVLWCPVSTCERSEAYGDDPFPKSRKDKLTEHIRRVHG